LQGGLTTRASEYCEGLCTEWAQLTRDRLCQDPALGELETDVEQQSGRLEQPWLNDLQRCLHWGLLHQSKVSDPTHINILEVRAAVRAASRVARRQA
jgi:hypothetical protein